MGNQTKGTPTVLIKDGELVEDAMQEQFIYGGEFYDGYASDVRICTYDGDVGGVFATGKGSYEIDGITVSKTGKGAGLGTERAGIASYDHANLTVRNANIYCNGQASVCSSAEEYSCLRVYNSTLISMGAPFGDDAPGGSVGSPPEALEIAGNTRTHCTQSNSYSYFYDSTIIGDGWAALSTDGSMGFVHLEADGCKVITTKGGYGTYADGCCHNFFHNCDFDVAHMAGIMAGECDITYKNSVFKCGTYFNMIHCVMGMKEEVGVLKVLGCDVRCKKAAMIVKSQNADIILDRTNLLTDEGVLVHSIVNDDPNATKTGGAKVYGIRVQLKNGTYCGDIVHEDTDRDMHVFIDGQTRLLGALKKSFLHMEEGGMWVATADSDIVIVDELDLDCIDAPPHVTISAFGGMSGEYTLASGGKLVVNSEHK